MTTYTKTTDFAAKDALVTGNPSKLVKGTEIDTEFNNIATADATSLKSGGALGTPSSGTLTNCTGLPAAGVTGTALVSAAIGTTVQAYDAQLDTWAGVTPGTGVATALAVNVGSAGAPVVNGGVLGTPSSGTLTNCTGYPAAQQTIVQVVESTPYTTASSHTTAIPYDDTIPQNTEGEEIITVSITPTNASNRLRIEFDAGVVSASGALDCTAALFQDATAGAIAAVGQTTGGANAALNFNLTHEMAAGGTSSTTFKIRMGPPSGTLYVNSTGAGRKYGGVAAVRLRVTEIKV